MLSYDICRCSNEKCPLKCRRKEPSDSERQSYAKFHLVKGKCDMQIKEKLDE